MTHLSVEILRRAKAFAGRSCAALGISLLLLGSSTAQSPSANSTTDAVNHTPAAAKNATVLPDPSRAQPTAKANQFHGVKFSGSLRLRFNQYRWFETPGYQDEYGFGEATLRLSLVQQREKFDWMVEGEFPLLLNLPEHAVAPAPAGQLGTGASYFAANGRRDGSAILKQAFVRLKGIFGDRPSRLRIGRIDFVDGMETSPADPTLATLKRDQIAHRLIGNFGFTAIGRSFDAVEYVRDSKRGNFTLLFGRPTEGVFQLRGLNELDVDIAYGAFTRPWTGKRAATEFRVLALHYHDGRGALKTDNRSAAMRRADTQNIRLTTLGGNYLAAIKTRRGTIDLLAWGVAQFGSWGTQTHRAGAAVFEGGFQPSGLLAKWKTWIRGGYSYTTGDGDAADNNHTTYFQVLPTPRWYARFPFYNMMNSEDAYAQFRIKPQTRVALRAEVHSLRLSNRADLWYAGGGAFQEGTFGYTGRPGGGRRGLGTMVDLSADLSVSPTTTLTFYVAGVRGGGVQSAIYPIGGTNPTSRMVYAELVKKF